MSEEKTKQPRGAAAFDPETRERVARSGGLAVSQDKAHMAEIGKKGGQSVSKNRAFMSMIGKKGGSTPRKKKENKE